MGWKRFAHKDAIGFFAELPHPIRLALYIDDVIDGSLGQPNSGVASRLEIIMEVADVAIIINFEYAIIHLLFSRHRDASHVPARAQAFSGSSNVRFPKTSIRR
jgi:hypothetical protein